MLGLLAFAIQASAVESKIALRNSERQHRCLAGTAIRLVTGATWSARVKPEFMDGTGS